MTLNVNGVAVEHVTVNGADIDKVNANGVEIWVRVVPETIPNVPNVRSGTGIAGGVHILFSIRDSNPPTTSYNVYANDVLVETGAKVVLVDHNGWSDGYAEHMTSDMSMVVYKIEAVNAIGVHMSVYAAHIKALAPPAQGIWTPTFIESTRAPVAGKLTDLGLTASALGLQMSSKTAVDGHVPVSSGFIVFDKATQTFSGSTKVSWGRNFYQITINRNAFVLTATINGNSVGTNPRTDRMLWDKATGKFAVDRAVGFYLPRQFALQGDGSNGFSIGLYVPTTYPYSPAIKFT